MCLSRWVPVQERSRSLALVYSGMYTGSVLGLAAAPHLIEVLAHLLLAVNAQVLIDIFTTHSVIVYMACCGETILLEIWRCTPYNLAGGADILNGG